MRGPAIASHAAAALAAALVTWAIVRNPAAGDGAAASVAAGSERHKMEERSALEGSEKPSNRNGLRKEKESGAPKEPGFAFLPDGSLVVPSDQKEVVRIWLAQSRNGSLDMEQLARYGCTPEQVKSMQAILDEVKQESSNYQASARRVLKQEGNETTIAIPARATEAEVKALQDSYRQKVESILGSARAEWLGDPFQKMLDNASYGFGVSSVVMTETRNESGNYSYQVYTLDPSYKDLPQSGEPLPDFDRLSRESSRYGGWNERPPQFQQAFQDL